MKILKKEALLSYLESESIERYFSFDIKPFIDLVEFKSGEYIYREGDLANYFFYIIKGKVKIYLTHKNGKISLVNFLEAPGFLGEMELVGAREFTKEAQALTDCICICFDKSKCEDRVLNDPIFLRHICLYIGKRSNENTLNYAQSQSYPLSNRLATFILLTNDNGLYTQKHSEVCGYLGVSYRHLLYVIADFCKKGILEKVSGGYKIINMALLNEIAKEI